MDSDPQGAPSETNSSVPPLNVGVTSAGDSSIEKRSSELDQVFIAGKGTRRVPALYFAALVAVLVACGSYSLLPIWLFMSRIWLQDPLRAIGSVFPVVAFIGTMAAWRRTGWAANGTLWGLPVLALSIVLARATTSLNLDFRIHQQNASVLHPGLAFFLYGVGAVLLFGGTRLLRAAIAPLCLLLCVNPVPYAYNAAVDLPLQFLSANTARHFAHLIGLQPTGLQLRMMFTPNFGMMIVPGCNGVRGSITLGYLALIFGYMRRLRPHVLAITALGAFLMGYVLNLLRLCVLVVYYRIGIAHESIQPYGAGVDYAIGCTLFLFATLSVGLFIRWIEPKSEEQKPARNSTASVSIGYAAAVRVGCFLLLTLLFIVPTLARGNSLSLGMPNEAALLSSFPAQVGNYRLMRTYSEYGNNGVVQFVLADYATSADSAGASSQMTLGFYVGLGMHMVASSRFAQGIRPDWVGSLETVDGSVPKLLRVHYVTSGYDDGIRREYDAESACYEAGCSASLDSSKSNFSVVAPKISDVFTPANGRRLPILLRREWPDTDNTPTATQRAQFEAEVQQFTQQLNLRTLLREDGIAN